MPQTCFKSPWPEQAMKTSRKGRVREKGGIYFHNFIIYPVNLYVSEYVFSREQHGTQQSSDNFWTF